MAVTGHKGTTCVQSGSRIVLRVPMTDSGGKVTSGTAPTVMFCELQSDGTLKTFDFSDNTFKSGAVATRTANMTHMTANNATYNTGVWSYVQSTVTGFTVGGLYLVEYYHATAYPFGRWDEFTYGSGEGDAVGTTTVLWGTYTVEDLLKDLGAGVSGDAVSSGGTYRLPGTSTTRLTVTNPATGERTVTRS